jgi:hypothetical protein
MSLSQHNSQPSLCTHQNKRIRRSATHIATLSSRHRYMIWYQLRPAYQV